MRRFVWCIVVVHGIVAGGCSPDIHIPISSSESPPSSAPDAAGCMTNADCSVGLVCMGSQCVGVGPDGRNPMAELCNGIDDNANGVVDEGCADGGIVDAGAMDGATSFDANAPDADTADGGFGVLVDSGLFPDAAVGSMDATVADAGFADTGIGTLVDSGVTIDSGMLDAALADAAAPDALPPTDTGVAVDAAPDAATSADATAADAAAADAMVADAGAVDSGPLDTGAVDAGFAADAGSSTLRTVHIVIDLPTSIPVAKDGVPGRAWFCHSFRGAWDCDTVTFLPLNATTQRLDLTYVNVTRVTHIANACVSSDCISSGSRWIVRRDVNPSTGTIGPFEDGPMNVTVDSMLRERRYAQNQFASFNWEFDAQ